MSNALRRKKKPTFYTKQELRIIGRNDFEKRNADKVISKSYKEFVVIGYIILHDKFGFGQASECGNAIKVSHDTGIMDNNNAPNYCSNCGCRLDWSDEE